MLKEKLTITQQMSVEEKDTAQTHGSGNLPVYATPAMIAFMENTACACIQPYLDNDLDTVGIQIDVKHIKATKLGGTVTCKAVLTEIDNKKLTFEIEASDEQGVIGTALHKRYIIHPEKFMSKL